MSELPDGLIAFGPNANCTLELCPIEWSPLQAQPSVAANSTFIALYSLFFIAHALQCWKYRTWGFSASILFGCVLEIVGYVGRIMLHDKPFDFIFFLIQIICITIAPVFFSAAIYVLLSQVTKKIDASISRFPPNYFYYIFIPADVISLVLQAAGGALSCIGSTTEDVQIGVDVSMAGLSFQVFIILVFCVLFVDYLVRCKKSPSSWQFVDKRMRFFLVFLFLSISLILLRCVYRVYELKDGYFSEEFRNEPLFIALESCVMCLAVFCLCVGHPGRVLSTKRTTTRRHEKVLSSDTSGLA